MPTEDPTPALSFGLRRPALLFGALLALAFVLRLVSALNDFWLDEIWSLQAVERLRSAAGVLTAFRHDNNHPLNSWVLYFLRGAGVESGWLAYRIPSCLAGTASVAVAWRLGARRDRATAFACAFIFALDYFLIHYSSEARGYAWVQLFTLTTILLARSFLEHPRALTAALLFASTCLGFLSHLTFLYAFAGVSLWLCAELLRTRASLRRALAQACAALGPACAFVTLYGLFFVRGLQYGGGEPSGKGEVLLKTLGWIFLGGSAKAQLWGGLAIFALLFARAGVQWWRTRSLDWILFAVAMVAAPLALLLSSREDFFSPRYFAVPAIFALLLLADLLASLLARPGPMRMLGAGACALFALVNAVPLRTLWADGRGSYLEAIDAICAADASGEITIGSDHDFRYPILLGFYAPYASACGQRLVYRRHDGNEPLPRWFLRSAFKPDFRPAPEGRLPYGAQLPPGEKLLLRAFYPSSELSGWGVIVYERVP